MATLDWPSIINNLTDPNECANAQRLVASATQLPTNPTLLSQLATASIRSLTLAQEVQERKDGYAAFVNILTTSTRDNLGLNEIFTLSIGTFSRDISHPNDRVRSFAMGALQHLFGAVDGFCLEALMSIALRGIKDPSYSVRLATVKCLGAACRVRQNAFKQSLIRYLQEIFATDPHAKVAALACQELAELDVSEWPQQKVARRCPVPRAIELLRKSQDPSTQLPILQLIRLLPMSPAESSSLCALLLGKSATVPAMPDISDTPQILTSETSAENETQIPQSLQIDPGEGRVKSLCELAANSYVRTNWRWPQTPSSVPPDIFYQLKQQYATCDDLVRYQDKRIYMAIRSLLGIAAKRGADPELINELKVKVDELGSSMGSFSTKSLSHYF